MLRNKNETFNTVKLVFISQLGSVNNVELHLRTRRRVCFFYCVRNRRQCFIVRVRIWSLCFVRKAARRTRQPLAYPAGHWMEQVFIVQIRISGTNQVGDGPAQEHGDEATDERVVHVGHRVQLRENVPATGVLQNPNYTTTYNTLLITPTHNSHAYIISVFTIFLYIYHSVTAIHLCTTSVVVNSIYHPNTN